MAADAMGNDIVVGEYYGYSKSSSGHTWVVTGRAAGTSNGKVILEDITEKNYLYVGEGKQDPHKVVKGDRKRVIGSVQVFHIHMSVMEAQDTQKHDCMNPLNMEPDGMLYRCSICKNIL